MSHDTKITVKLYCPSLSKVVHFGACDFSQRLDLGCIASAFELDPHSLKLNGHFISRGADLIASSVTWNSLLSFFSARGLPTGLSGSAPLVVDGKLLYRVGTKREYNQISSSLKRRSLSEDQNSLKRTKTDETDLGEENHIDSSLKKRSLSADQNSLKRTRINVPDLVSFKGNVDISNINNSTNGSSQLSCSFISQNMKREREDDMLLAGPSKRLRIPPVLRGRAMLNT